jgi:hypothetical protein
MDKETYKKTEAMFTGRAPRDQEFLNKEVATAISKGEKPQVKSYPKEKKYTKEEMDKLQEEFARQFGPHKRE